MRRVTAANAAASEMLTIRQDMGSLVADSAEHVFEVAELVGLKVVLDGVLPVFLDQLIEEVRAEHDVEGHDLS